LDNIDPSEFKKPRKAWKDYENLDPEKDLFSVKEESVCVEISDGEGDGEGGENDSYGDGKNFN